LFNNGYNEVIRLWNIGKELGFMFIGDDEIIINILKEMEEVDRIVNKRKKNDKEKFLNEDSNHEYKV